MLLLRWTRFRLEQGQFGKPDVFYLTGETPVDILPGVTIATDALVQRLPERDLCRLSSAPSTAPQRSTAEQAPFPRGSVGMRGVSAPQACL